jgi:hypothetical protein
MTEGNVQLVAIGPQDAHFTGEPQVTFFRSTFNRYTNFSTFMKKQLIIGNPKPGGQSTIRIEKYGDLLNYMFLTVAKNDETQMLSNWSNVIESAELMIGGSVVDTQDSIFSEEIAVDTFASTGSKSYPAGLHGGVGSPSFFYPFRFFCCESWTSSLPLCALPYHDVDIRIRWAQNLDPSLSIEFGAMFVTLDTEERVALMKKKQNDILIFQVQKSVPSFEKIQELNFNHPVKFMASSNTDDDNELISRTNKITLKVNGVDISETNYSIPFFTSIPSYYHTTQSSSNAENLFIHPFCLETSRNQPNGSLNFSRVSSFEIHCTRAITRPIYAVNYNILRIQNGLAGLLYAN